jgi:hypothetical protein
MRRCAFPLLVLLGWLISGCSSSRYSTDYPLSSYSRTSTDGEFQYRVPQGWFAALDDPLVQQPSSTIWLLRNDYRATIAVSELKVDSVALSELRRYPITRVAQLTMALAVNGGSSILQRTPETFTISGREFCGYEVENPETGENMRIVVFAAGGKLYEATALLKGKEGSEDMYAMLAAQQSFLKSLRW